ncbi:MAG TPA: 16S rRNA (uracil(1498)-N(3))-methyltransferase [Terriglobia bacterium]|nr:16S rRNA (uracil(1498)-N(3))-methyltransferase [Terriglobia bacterium]
MNLIILVEKDFRTDPKHAQLEGRRAIHLRTVLRSRLGSVVRVGLLNGPMGKGVVVAQTDAQVTLEVNLSEAPPPPLPATLLVALPRPKSFRRILQAAAAFGVERLVFMESWRVEKSFWGSTLLEPDALNEQLIVGLEQGCGTRPPDVLIRRRFRPFVEDELPAMASGRLALLAHPRSGTLCPARLQQPFCLALGPEGGWTPFEVELFTQGGFVPVHLGDRILRVEQAVPAFLGRLV